MVSRRASRVGNLENGCLVKQQTVVETNPTLNASESNSERLGVRVSPNHFRQKEAGVDRDLCIPIYPMHRKGNQRFLDHVRSEAAQATPEP